MYRKIKFIDLTMTIYVQRELESGIGETPVMCTTVERRKKEHYSEVISGPNFMNLT